MIKRVRTWKTKNGDIKTKIYYYENGKYKKPSKYITTKKGDFRKTFEKLFEEETKGLDNIQKYKLKSHIEYLIASKRKDDSTYRMTKKTLKSVSDYALHMNQLRIFFINMSFDWSAFANENKLDLEDVLNESNWNFVGGVGTFSINGFSATVYFDYDNGCTYRVNSDTRASKEESFNGAIPVNPLEFGDVF